MPIRINGDIMDRYNRDPTMSYHGKQLDWGSDAASPGSNPTTTLTGNTYSWYASSNGNFNLNYNIQSFLEYYNELNRTHTSYPNRKYDPQYMTINKIHFRGDFGLRQAGNEYLSFAIENYETTKIVYQQPGSGDTSNWTTLNVTNKTWMGDNTGTPNCLIPLNGSIKGFNIDLFIGSEVNFNVSPLTNWWEVKFEISVYCKDNSYGYHDVSVSSTPSNVAPVNRFTQNVTNGSGYGEIYGINGVACGNGLIVSGAHGLFRKAWDINATHTNNVATWRHWPSQQNPNGSGAYSCHRIGNGRIVSFSSTADSNKGKIYISRVDRVSDGALEATIPALNDWYKPSLSSYGMGGDIASGLIGVAFPDWDVTSSGGSVSSYKQGMIEVYVATVSGTVSQAAPANFRTCRITHPYHDPAETSPSNMDDYNAQFGEVMAMGYGRIVVGCPDDTIDGIQTGAVYIFDAVHGKLIKEIRTGDVPTALTTTGSSVAPQEFGSSVDIASGRIFVGSEGQISAPTGGVPGGVFCFDLNGNLLWNTYWDNSDESKHSTSGNQVWAFGRDVKALGSNLVFRSSWYDTVTVNTDYRGGEFRVVNIANSLAWTQDYNLLHNNYVEEAVWSSYRNDDSKYYRLIRGPDSTSFTVEFYSWAVNAGDYDIGIGKFVIGYSYYGYGASGPFDDGAIEVYDLPFDENDEIDERILRLRS